MMFIYNSSFLDLPPSLYDSAFGHLIYHGRKPCIIPNLPCDTDGFYYSCPLEVEAFFFFLETN